MLLIYGKCQEHSKHAVRSYAERYPNRHLHVLNIFQFYRAFTAENDDNNEIFIFDEGTEINVLGYVEVNATICTGKIGQKVQISNESVRQILKKKAITLSLNKEYQ